MNQTRVTAELTQAQRNARFVLYCKSYAPDVLRAKRLLASIQKHNVTGLPFYLSTPRADRDLFETHLGTQGYTWIADEDICVANPKFKPEYLLSMSGYLSQQVVKSEFWRLGLCETYLCLDSDAKFIRDFSSDDFLDTDGTPFTVMHDAKNLLDAASKAGLNDILENFKAESQRLKVEFGRVGPDWDFGPVPMIWSAKVWQDLADKYLAPKGETLWDAVARIPTEIRWYGEALLQFQSIAIRPIAPRFVFYHFEWLYLQDRQQGVTEQTLAKTYVGVVYQSNWELGMNTQAMRKSWLSRFVRSIKSKRIAFRALRENS